MKKIITTCLLSTLLSPSFSTEIPVPDTINFENSTLETSDEVIAIAENIESNEEIKIPVYNIETKENYITGEVTEMYGYTVDLEKLDNPYELDLYNDGSSGAYDSSYSVYGYVAYSYSKSTYLSYTGYLLKSVSGGWNIKDSSVSLSNRIVNYGCTGLDLKSNNNVTQSNTKYPSGNSFSYTTGYTKYIRDAVIGNGLLGVNTSVTLKHGGSSVWKLTVASNSLN